MDEPVKKRVDESWKEQAEREKRVAESSAAAQTPSPQTPASAKPGEGEEGLPEARFDLFLSGLAMEALIALGDIPHPSTKKQAANLPHAKYLVDLIGVLEEKTKGNLVAEEEQLLKDTLYQLRMRYLGKTGG
jgi:hypothetical protein